jgi:glutamate dehydrogenase (NADP+)
MSDSGYIYDADGIDADKLALVMELKNELRGRISDYVKKYPNAKYFAGNVHGKLNVISHYLVQLKTN